MILLSLDLTSWSSASALPRPQLVDTYRTRSYKNDDEPLLNLTGAMSRCSREKMLMCTQKRELESPL